VHALCEQVGFNLHELKCPLWLFASILANS
jgi:hypothetical protein